jgi:hypothetical protein
VPDRGRVPESADTLKPAGVRLGDVQEVSNHVAALEHV